MLPIDITPILTPGARVIGPERIAGPSDGQAGHAGSRSCAILGAEWERRGSAKRRQAR